MKTLEQIKSELVEATAKTEQLWEAKKEAEARYENELKPFRDAWYQSTKRVEKLTVAIEVITEEPKPF